MSSYHRLISLTVPDPVSYCRDSRYDTVLLFEGDVSGMYWEQSKYTRISTDLNLSHDGLIGFMGFMEDHILGQCILY